MSAFSKEELLEEGEVIIDTVRKHWIVYVQDVLLHAFGCIMFIVFAQILLAKGGSLGQYAPLTEYGAMIFGVFVLIFWTSFFFFWTLNYFDVWYVTNEHIIAIDQKDIFHRDESFMKLDKIQDVSLDKAGVISNLFGYGELTVQSAGEELKFVMQDVRGVEQLSHKIMDLRDEVQKKISTVAG